MIRGSSSEFVESIQEFVQKNNKSLNVTILSDGMSRSFYRVNGFENLINPVNGMSFLKMNSVGGNSTFMNLSPNASMDLIGTLDLRSIVDRAMSRNLISVQSNVVEESDRFAVRIPESHLSYIFFGGDYTRPGYIIDTGDDPDDMFELDENRDNMIVYTNELSVGQNLYYYFYPDEDAYVPNLRIFGLDASIVNGDQLSSDVNII